MPGARVAGAAAPGRGGGGGVAWPNGAPSTSRPAPPGGRTGETAPPAGGAGAWNWGAAAPAGGAAGRAAARAKNAAGDRTCAAPPEATRGAGRRRDRRGGTVAARPQRVGAGGVDRDAAARRRATRGRGGPNARARARPRPAGRPAAAGGSPARGAPPTVLVCPTAAAAGRCQAAGRWQARRRRPWQRSAAVSAGARPRRHISVVSAFHCPCRPPAGGTRAPPRRPVRCRRLRLHLLGGGDWQRGPAGAGAVHSAWRTHGPTLPVTVVTPGQCRPSRCTRPPQGGVTPDGAPSAANLSNHVRRCELVVPYSTGVPTSTTSSV